MNADPFPPRARRALAILTALALIGAAYINNAEAASTPRVVGGTQAATPGWMTQVWNREGRFLGICGGQLVTTRWVLTAAHCATSENAGNAPLAPQDFVLRVGVPVAGTPNASEFGTSVDRVVVNPVYTSATPYGDLALLHLPAPAAQLPIALGAPAQAVSGATPDVLGWGRTGNTDAEGASTALLSVRQPILDASACSSYGTDFVAESMICAGGIVGQDSCVGDSGGPLALDAQGTDAVLLGTVDYGPDRCGNGRPAVYQRVTEGTAATWLRSVVSLPNIGTPTTSPVKGTIAPMSASSAWPDATFDWDLDGNGSYGDATGASIRPTINSPRAVSVAATSASLQETAVSRITLTPVDPLKVTTSSRANEGSLVSLRLTPPAGLTGTMTLKTSGVTKQSRTVTINAARTIRIRLPKDKRYHSPRKLTINLTTTGALKLAKRKLTVTVKDLSKKR